MGRLILVEDVGSANIIYARGAEELGGSEDIGGLGAWYRRVCWVTIWGIFLAAGEGCLGRIKGGGC